MPSATFESLPETPLADINRGAVVLVKHVWGGDHKKCKHETEGCGAIDAWMLNADGKLIPRICLLQLEDQFAQTFKTGRGPIEGVMGYRGWRELDEAKLTHPTNAVLEQKIGLRKREVEQTGRLDKDKIAEIRAAVADMEKSLREANPVHGAAPAVVRPSATPQPRGRV